MSRRSTRAAAAPVAGAETKVSDGGNCELDSKAGRLISLEAVRLPQKPTWTTGKVRAFSIPDDRSISSHRTPKVLCHSPCSAA
jgi:hypothetical protein